VIGNTLYTASDAGMSIPISHEAVAIHALLERGGEESAYAPSVELLKMLYRQMRVLAGPRPDLDDLVQCAAERVLRALPRFEGRSALSTFVYGVAYRTLLGHDRWYRRWSRRFSLADDQVGESEDDAESRNKQPFAPVAQRACTVRSRSSLLANARSSSCTIWKAWR
jgi:DNA-directed RNA polymerase specialized sigma24 family protein